MIVFISCKNKAKILQHLQLAFYQSTGNKIYSEAKGSIHLLSVPIFLNFHHSDFNCANKN